MKNFLFYLLPLLTVSCNNKQTKITDEWKLIWSDEFDKDGLPDSANWNYDTGGHGWGNHELQYYTKADTANAVVRDGLLHIKAIKKTIGNNIYTSARLITRSKRIFTYGKIEIKAKLPKGKGLWPAIWMLGSNIDTADWPNCGEIDIMEHVGFMPDSVFGSIHTKSFNHTIHTQRTKGLFIADPYTSFHTYAVEWTSEKITFLVDGKSYLEFSNTHKGSDEWPFDKPQFLLLNIAVGGDWGGQQGIDETVFPAEMQVGYVRYYQK